MSGLEETARKSRRPGPRKERMAISMERRTLRALAGGLIVLAGSLFAVGFWLGARRSNTPEVEATAGAELLQPKPELEPVRTATIAPSPSRKREGAGGRAHDLRDEQPPVTIHDDAPLGRYGVQIGAYPERAEAIAFAQAHAEEIGDVPVYVVASEIPGKGIWHRVRIGSFKGRAGADALRARFSESLKKSSIVVRYR